MLVVRASTLITSEGCGRVGRSQRRQHGRHHHARFVPGLAKRGFIVFRLHCASATAATTRTPPSEGCT